MSNDPSASLTDPIPRMPFLDGIRGWAAFYILIYHCYFAEVTSISYQENWPSSQRLLVHWLGFGEEAMPVFMVLSGFCLMLPALRSGLTLGESFGSFILRRARRVLIPYYAALLICIALIAIVPNMDRINIDLFKDPLFKSTQAPNFSPPVIGSHFFLVEHAKYAWKFGIDPPVWGVAAIWWHYFFFGLLLLPLWRKIGGRATLLLAIALSILPRLIYQGMNAAAPWYLGLFALGMAAASQLPSPYGRGPTHGFMRAVRERFRFLWLVAAGVFLLAAAIIGFGHEPWMWQHIYVMDYLVGGIVVCLIIFCSNLSNHGQIPLPFPFSVLESRPSVKLGDISYSLILTHFPIVWMLHFYITSPMQINPLQKCGLLLLMGVPASLLAAWAFYQTVERRFKTRNPKPETRNPTSALPPPAPSSA